MGEYKAELQNFRFGRRTNLQIIISSFMFVYMYATMYTMCIYIRTHSIFHLLLRALGGPPRLLTKLLCILLVVADEDVVKYGARLHLHTHRGRQRHDAHNHLHAQDEDVVKYGARLHLHTHRGRQRHDAHNPLHADEDVGARLHLHTHRGRQRHDAHNPLHAG